MKRRFHHFDNTDLNKLDLTCKYIVGPYHTTNSYPNRIDPCNHVLPVEDVRTLVLGKCSCGCGYQDTPRVLRLLAFGHTVVTFGLSSSCQKLLKRMKVKTWKEKQVTCYKITCCDE